MTDFTITDDLVGRRVEVDVAAPPSELDVRASLVGFVGEIWQRPPVHSAVKVGGTPAYRLARAGRPVRMRPRKVRIERINLISFRSPLAEIEVQCGKGTYIRTLADDLGHLLGCGAHIQALQRTSVGPFSTEDAISPERLETAFADGTWQNLLLPLDYGLGHIPTVYLDTEAEKDIRRGCSLEASSPPFQRLPDAQNGERYRAYAENGSFVAILRYDADSSRWKPQKVFSPAHPAF